MKFKIGALVAVIVAGLLVVPPLLSRVSANEDQHEFVMQLDCTQAVVDGEVQEILGKGGTAIAPTIVDGHTMLPLQWIAEAAGLTVAWDNDSQSTTLTRESSKKTHIVFAVGKKTAEVGDQVIDLDVPVTIQSGTTYVSTHALSEVLGWNVDVIDEQEGALIFIDNRKDPKTPDEAHINKVIGLIGPSHAQLRSSSIIGREGSGTLLVNGVTHEMKIGENQFPGVISLAENQIHLPIEAATVAIAEQGDADYHAALTGVSAQGGSTATDDAEMVYATVEEFASQMGMHLTVSNTVFAFTKADVAKFPDKADSLLALGAALPDKKPDIPDAKGYIALTFDDGPTGGTDGLTVQLLNGLKTRDAHATFFMCGYRIKDFHTHMERYLAEGHELGNHSMNHPMKPILAKMPVDGSYNEIVSNSELIESYTGQGTTVMRPVGGTVTDNLKAAMKKAGQPIINWNVDTLDWKYRDAARIKKVIVEQAKDGDIVLMHDLHQPTVDGVLAAIDELQKQGYAFVTVSELAQIKGITLEPGVVYTGFGDKQGYAG